MLYLGTTREKNQAKPPEGAACVVDRIQTLFGMA